MKCDCGGTLKISKTEQIDTRTIRRERTCERTGKIIRSHERMYPDANNQFEQRLVEYYRNLDQPQRETLWSLMRTFNPERTMK